MKKLVFPFSKEEGVLDVLDNEPTLDITENGEYNVRGYNKVNVNVEGSGSSDFSTAEVTIVGGSNGLALTGGVEGMSNGFIFIKTDADGDSAITIAGATAETTITTKALLFRNLVETDPHDFTAIFEVLDGTIASVEGNCEIDEDTGVVLIWGDCTITGASSQ